MLGFCISAVVGPLLITSLLYVYLSFFTLSPTKIRLKDSSQMCCDTIYYIIVKTQKSDKERILKTCDRNPHVTFKQTMKNNS